MFNYDRLNELIAESGKTKTYLSQKMGHGPRYLNDAKKNNTKIKDSDLAILAEELQTTVEYLKGQTNKKSPTLQAESEVDRDDIKKWLENRTLAELSEIMADVADAVRRKMENETES